MAARDSDKCFHCNNLGHWRDECPELLVRVNPLLLHTECRTLSHPPIAPTDKRTPTKNTHSHKMNMTDDNVLYP
jgi:hypothetical protein